MKTLNIISSAYRGTLEEQDDTIVWLTHAMRGVGAPIDVLLRGAAVNYVMAGQETGPLTIGARTQRHSPNISGEVARLIANKAMVYVMADDIEQRGLDPARVLQGVHLISAPALAELLATYQNIWCW